jgi:hypothetical protein
MDFYFSHATLILFTLLPWIHSKNMKANKTRAFACAPNLPTFIYCSRLSNRRLNQTMNDERSSNRLSRELEPVKATSIKSRYLWHNQEP